MATVADMDEAINLRECDRLGAGLADLDERTVIECAMMLSKQTRYLIKARGIPVMDPLANCARGAFMALNELLRRLAPDDFGSIINEVFRDDEEDDDDA